MPSEHSEPSIKKTILILAANPKGTVPLRLDEEVREIKAGLQRSRHRDRFVVEYESAARPRDVRRAILDYKPQVVHFCGHGEGQKGLVLEDEQGNPKLVGTTALADLFKLFADQVEGVVLNACYSEAQAKAIAQHIKAVIGMNQPIGDQAAIEFAVGFYDALGAGESIPFAFELGRNAMQLEGIAEDRTPVLIAESVPVTEIGARFDAMTAGEMEKSRKLTPIGSDPKSNKAGSSERDRSEMGRSRIFISYKRGVVPDEPVAMAIYQALRQDHEVFIDQTMTVGTPWAERIKAEIRQSDFLITLLSAHSVQSEMVVVEVEMAHHLFQEQGKPMILPIRVAYREPFVYPLNAYLNRINWAFWDSEADTERLLQGLRQTIAGEPLSINTELLVQQPLEIQETTKELNSQSYVQRESDELDSILPGLFHPK